MRRVRGALAAAVTVAAVAGAAAGVDSLAPFSTLPPGGALPAAWKALKLPNWKAPEYALVADGDATVLRARVAAAAGTVAHDLDADPRERPMLAWRWKIDHVVEKADMTRRSGDDFSARIYVYFDVAPESLPFATRAKLRVAEIYYGLSLPTATICYVWDNRNPPGTTAWSPYTDRVRVVVLESGNANAGRWMEERRDLDADFRAAFGGEWSGPAPHVKGVALGNDTDQTKETVTAWFGDVRLEARR